MATATPMPSPIATAVTEGLGEALKEFEQDVFSLGFVDTLIFAAVVAGITFLIIKVLSKIAKKKLTGNMRVFYRLIYVLVITIAVFVVLMTITPLREFATAIIASSGIAAVVIGLAAQETLNNVISGLSIGISKPFEVGEYIEIVDVKVSGTVERIELRHTIIKDFTNKRIVVPNSVINKNVIKSSKISDTENCNYFEVGVAYDTNLDLAKKIILELAQAHPKQIDARTQEQKERGIPEVVFRIVDFLPYSIQLRALVWSKDVYDGFELLSDLRYQVKKRFDAEGIEIPMPYQNVIIKEGRRPKS